MKRLIVAVEKINSLTAALYIIGLAVLYWMGYPDLWGGLLILTGTTWLIRQFLMGRILDLFFVLFVFGGAWASHFFIFYPYYVIPSLLAVGSLYIIVEQITTYWRSHSSPKELSSEADSSHRTRQG